MFIPMTISCPVARRNETGWRSRLWWRRLERRARRSFDRDLLAALRQLALENAPVVAAETPSSKARVVRLRLPGLTLAFAGVHPAVGERLTEAAAAGRTLRLVTAGRYGRLWWIAFSDGGAETVVAASHLRLTGDGGGASAGDRELGPSGGEAVLVAVG